MASSKKKQDEKHLKILREMVALAHNKQCFDCHQRGPTYINMTIGSYVCTACSGLLRGLNPPHRVKSISMASFTPEEMDFIKSHGNEFCRKVWLGLYDNRLGNQAESREESKVKDFMTQKYERKRYYVAPTETMMEEAKRMNESAISKTPGTRPLKSLLGENAPKIQLANHQGSSSAPGSQQNFFDTEDQAQNPSTDVTNTQPGNDLFVQSSGLKQQPDNDLFSQSSNLTQQLGNDLFNQSGGSAQHSNSLFNQSDIQQQENSLFGQTSGSAQQSRNDFSLGSNDSVLSSAHGNNLFPLQSAVSQSQHGLDLFGSSSSGNQSAGSSLFASSNTAASVPGTTMFGSSSGSQLQQNNLGSNLFQQQGASQFAASSGSLLQSNAVLDGSQLSSLSINSTAVGDFSASQGVGGQTQGQGQTSGLFSLNTGVTLTTGSPNDVQLQQSGGQNPFNLGGQGHGMISGQGQMDQFGSQLTPASTASQVDLFGGFSSQGQTQGQPSNLGNQGIAMETNPFGGLPMNTVQMSKPAISSTQGQPSNLGNHGIAMETNPFGGLPSNADQMSKPAISSPFGTLSSQMMSNTNVQEPKPVSATPPPISSTPQSPGNQSVQSSKSSGSTAMDLLGDLGGDPFASSAPQTQTTGGFADFGNFGNTGSQSNSGFPPASQTAGFPPATQQTSQPPPFAQSTPLQPFGSTSSSSNNSQILNGSVAPPAPAAGGDKYSNLSDLFSMATTTESEPATSAGWGLSSTNTSGGINWSSGSTAPSSGGINWGGDSSSSTNVGGVNWNSSSTSQSSSSNTSMGWGGASTSNVASTGMSGMSWGGTPATAQSNVSNPFGGSSGTSLTTQSSMGTAGASNPFGGQVPGAQQGGFGAYGSQAGGFGQFGAQQNAAVNSAPGGQFGQFGVVQNGAGFGAMTSTGGFGNVQTSTQAGFRQPAQPFAAQPGFGQQQPGVGGFGAMPQGGFGAQSAGFGQPGYGAQPQQMAQGFGGWGQQAPVSSTANPFMSTVQQYSAAPKSGATNPFL